MPRLVFAPPDEKSPGYLRRARAAIALQERVESALSVALVDEIVDFLLPYVKEPEDRHEAREALLDASREQFTELLSAVAGGSKNVSAPANAGSSSGDSEAS
jgi:hypothetical protein